MRAPQGNRIRKIVRGKEARFQSCELESCQLRAQDNCLLGLEDRLLAASRAKRKKVRVLKGLAFKMVA
jgi:hypothetical protein